MEILGLNGTPDAGDQFAVVESEKRAREIAEFRYTKNRDNRLQRQQASKLDNMFESMTAGERKTLNIVLKADVRGSLEAIQTALVDLGNDEVQVNIVVGGVGGITETDVNLAVTSRAVIFGFNVRADGSARKLVESEGVDLRYYNVIYNLIDDVKAGPDRHADSGAARRDRRYCRGPGRIWFTQVWPGGRLYGDRGNRLPRQAYPRAA